MQFSGNLVNLMQFFAQFLTARSELTLTIWTIVTSQECSTKTNLNKPTQTIFKQNFKLDLLNAMMPEGLQFDNQISTVISTNPADCAKCKDAIVA